MVLVVENKEVEVNRRQIVQVLVAISKGNGILTEEGNKILSAIR